MSYNVKHTWWKNTQPKGCSHKECSREMDVGHPTRLPAKMERCLGVLQVKKGRMSTPFGLFGTMLALIVKTWRAKLIKAYQFTPLACETATPETVPSHILALLKTQESMEASFYFPAQSEGDP